jgi:hypothetical protein
MEFGNVPADYINMSPNETLGPSKKRSLKKTILFIVLLIIYSAILLATGILLGSSGKRAPSNKLNQLAKLNDPSDPMYANIQGALNGQITKIEGSKAYVTSDKGGTGILNIGDLVLVSEIAGGKLVELGNTSDKVRLNETGIIKIAGVGNGYLIYAVTYSKDMPPALTPPVNPTIPDSPSPKPASSSAKTKK